MCTISPPILTTAALRRAGTAGRDLRREVDAGALRRARRGVFVRPGVCAAVAATAEHGGRIACITAARHLGLWVLTDDARAHVGMRDGQRAYHPSADEGACTCVEHWDERPAGPADGTAEVPLMLLQIRRCAGLEEFFVVLESALRRGLVDQAGMRWLRKRSNSGMREALALARADADSGLESLLRWRLRRHGLRVRTQQRVSGVGVVDALVGDRLIVEADGTANHDGVSLRHKDLVRDANAAMWGYVTLRFDYALIVHDWELVEAAILGTLHTLARAR